MYWNCIQIVIPIWIYHPDWVILKLSSQQWTFIKLYSYYGLSHIWPMILYYIFFFWIYKTMLSLETNKWLFLLYLIYYYIRILVISMRPRYTYRYVLYEENHNNVFFTRSTWMYIGNALFVQNLRCVNTIDYNNNNSNILL